MRTDDHNQIDTNKIIDFIKKNVRYFAAGVLFIALLVVLILTNGNRTTETAENIEATEIETEAVFATNAYPEVNELIQNYYAAYAAGDIATLTTLATPVSANEQGYISIYSQYVEEYQNMVYYTKPGLDANSYMVSVYFEIKFVGVDTNAPGLDFFYVRTNEDGTLYIDNLYSQYNMRQNENPMDISVEALIQEYEKQADVVALLQEVQLKYEEAVASDENLATMINVTIPDEIAQWVTTIISQSTEVTEATESTETVEEPTEEQPTEGETPEETQETVSETVYTTDKVNVRAAADQNSDRLGQVDKGTSLNRTGTEGDWSIVDYNGQTGYIKSEFLKAGSSENTAEEGTAASNGLTEGTVITLEETTNIRSGMDETSDKVGVAYPGEKVTVVMSYAEGWTKVTWNNKTGYIKTELLQ